MQPIVDGLEEIYSDQVAFVSLDAAGDGKAAFDASNLPGHPSFLIMQPDGEEVWRRAGVVGYADMDTVIQEALN
jgi:hypothetical protein